jgi:hypothetical protein
MMIEKEEMRLKIKQLKYKIEKEELLNNELQMKMKILKDLQSERNESDM